MITIKNSAQIEKMREAGKALHEVLTQLKEKIEPGITTKELDRIAEKLIRPYGAVPSFLNYEGYPANPNGSPWSVAGVCSHDGRHLAMMPHLERAMFPWQCGYYPAERKNDEVTPWIEAFVNARKWVESHKA